MRESVIEFKDISTIEFFPEKGRIEIDVQHPAGAFFPEIPAQLIEPFGWTLIQPVESLNPARIVSSKHIGRHIVTVRNTDPIQHYVIRSRTGDFTEDIGCETEWDGTTVKILAPFREGTRCECEFKNGEKPLTHRVQCTKK